LVVATGVDVCCTDDWLDVDIDKLELLSDNESGSRLRFSASAIYAYTLYIFAPSPRCTIYEY